MNKCLICPRDVLLKKSFHSVEKAKKALLEDFKPISDARASKKYRILVAGNLLERFFIETTSKEGLFQLADRRLYEEEKNA